MDELQTAVKEVIGGKDNERTEYAEALMAITVDESLKSYCQCIGRSDFWVFNKNYKEKEIMVTWFFKFAPRKKVGMLLLFVVSALMFGWVLYVGRVISRTSRLVHGKEEISEIYKRYNPYEAMPHIICSKSMPHNNPMFISAGLETRSLEFQGLDERQMQHRVSTDVVSQFAKE